MGDLEIPEGVGEINSFVLRKSEHIQWSLNPMSQTFGLGGFEQIELVHEAFPEMNFEEIQIQQASLGRDWATPFFVSSMTAGHDGAQNINDVLAQACDERGWPMGVGSQRRQLMDSDAIAEWSEFRKRHPKTSLFANVGLSQVVSHSPLEICQLAESIQAMALIVHVNPLQEALQPEGTPQFKGGLKAISTLKQQIGIPLIIKETGCGFSARTLKNLRETGVDVVDVSGLGGTHWGRIEGFRSEETALNKQVAATFANWGISTVQSLVNAKEAKADYEVWASGGVRTGLDAAKSLVLGARMVGLAQPLLAAATQGVEQVLRVMSVLEQELKVAMFCTGCQSIQKLQQRGVWTWKPR